LHAREPIAIDRHAMERASNGGCKLFDDDCLPDGWTLTKIEPPDRRLTAVSPHPRPRITEPAWHITQPAR
jgi:hypothetical protein